VKRIYHLFLGGAALTVAALAAMIVVSGGWQPVAAALAMLGGGVFVLSFSALIALGERPRPKRRSWASGRERPHGTPAGSATSAAAAERAPVTVARRRLSSASP
jgi:hypothetical protein